jgi:hypothetical protein
MPMPYITIKTATYPTELYLSQTLLENEGIRTYLKDELTVQVDPLISNALGGVKLQVPEEDAFKAIEILKQAGHLNEQEFQPSAFWVSLNETTRDLPFMKRQPVELRLIILLALVCLVVGVLVFVTMD